MTALRAYFAGDLHALDRLSVDPIGTTFNGESGRRCELSGRPDRLIRRHCQRDRRAHVDRAVGAANGANPIAIVVPCHRIIGSGGSLVGYGGGLERKRWLLEHEGVLLEM